MKVMLINQDSYWQSEVQDAWMQTYLKPKYKYVHCNYAESLTFDENTWVHDNWAIINDDYELVGYVEGGTNRVSYTYSFNLVVNFTDDKITMGKGLAAILGSIIYRNFHRLEWLVVSENPIKDTYEKLVKEFRGRREGVFKENVKMWDGRYADTYEYGVLIRKIPEDVKKKYLRYYHKYIGSDN